MSPISPLFLSSLLFVISFPSLCFSLNQEGKILQTIKKSFDDPHSFLVSWNENDDTPCSWFGVTCDFITSSVVSLDLSHTNIAGPFPSLICTFPNLIFLSLSSNFINGSLPSNISSCVNLQTLDVSDNFFVGEIPSSLVDIPYLRSLDLSANNFSGEIPARFGSFQRLEVLSVVSNLLNTTVPSFLGNITSLKMLNLSYNPLAPGKIPSEFGNLTNLKTLWLSHCNLVGEIPDSLGQLKKLANFDVSVNNLHGSFPQSLTGLINIVQIEIYNNSLSGELPSGFSNLTKLKMFDASTNMFTGSIPEDLCGLELASFNLYDNEFEGNLPESLANSKFLFEVNIFGNKLSGVLPKNLGKNSPLRSLDVSGNSFSGNLPDSLCENGVLKELLGIHNQFSGEIPVSLGECQSLIRVRFAKNRFSGNVPENFWGLPRLYLMDFENNMLSGKISKNIVGARNLSMLFIAHNNFTGTIPEEIGFLENLVEFSGGYNMFSGRLPNRIVNMERLGSLKLQNNMLSGELPSDVQFWKKLNELNLANNLFSGEIPESIATLPVLNYLDLSGNQFTGKIPFGFLNLNLNLLNLSYNQLCGRLPIVFHDKMYRNSFLGNPDLCRDEHGSCDKKTESVVDGHVWLLRSIFIIAGLSFVLIVAVVWVHFKYVKCNEVETDNAGSKWTLISFHKFSFNEDKILDCLEEDNIIGSGSSGQVYKVVLGNGEIVAVKKLWGHRAAKESSHGDDWNQDDAFDAEVKTLGKIRHKNIVKLWCCCTSRDCKLLVYEYMPNGSLGELLHGSKGGSLDWPTRYKIALDAAEGLSYLHHDCVPPILHRDIKSNNILLDADLGARVADFGVSKALDMSDTGPKSMSVVAGSCGYIAPEYAYTLRVNEKSDIYSFGVVILELVTGKYPIDEEFGEKDLVKWVCTTLDKKGMDQVLDPKLNSHFNEEKCKVLNIGLLCTNPLPINRPSMRRVVKMLQEVDSDNQSKSAKIHGRLSPYYYEDSSNPGSLA